MSVLQIKADKLAGVEFMWTKMTREKSVIFAGRTSYDILMHYKVNFFLKKGQL